MTHLFSTATWRGVTAKNHILVSPMCTYSAQDGIASDWHFVHYGKLAQGGAGTVMVEATAVVAEGRITHGDLGLWHDGQIAPLKRIADFIRAHGSVPAIQLAHAGRKASMQRPWFGNAALTPQDHARGDLPWSVVAPSPVPLEEGWLKPHELSRDDMIRLREAWQAAAHRALACSFDFVEVHCAHGYLMHEFLSPLSNKRDDAYGGSRENRMRYPLEIIAAVRAIWPDDKPMSVRISSVDGLDGGWTLEDSVAFAREAKAQGADLIDCSSGGLTGSATAVRIPRGYGFQVPFAQSIREQAQIPTIAVGLIVHPEQAEEILANKQADLIAIGREVLFNPNWPLHAELTLRGESGAGEVFGSWPQPYGWWLERRESGLRRLDGPPLPFRKAPNAS